MASYLNELLARVVAIELEAMASIDIAADAKPYALHVNTAFPYFTNRIASIPITDNGSQDEDVNSPIVAMRLVVAHTTAKYRGEVEANLYEWIPVIKSVFNTRMWLQSAAYPARMDNLQSARIIEGGGLRIFENTGVSEGPSQVGAELQLQCIFNEHIEQEFY